MRLRRTLSHLDTPNDTNATGATDRPLLSKYLSPERDDSVSSDNGSTVSDRTTRNDKKRISRFLRPDFFDAPPDESLYLKHKKEREMETQEVLREIREKKNKTPEFQSLTRRASDVGVAGKCFSPTGIKERSRSNTPFYPILDNIKESALDSLPKYYSEDARVAETDRSRKLETPPIRESRLMRPRSYPVKNDDDAKRDDGEKISNLKDETDSKDANKESRLLRPRSYPASSSSPEKYVKSKKVNNEDAKQNSTENKTDVEVTFNVSLPRKSKPKETTLETSNKEKVSVDRKSAEGVADLSIKKYEVVDNKNTVTESLQKTDQTTPITNGKYFSIKKSEMNGKEEPKRSSINSEDIKLKTENKEENGLKPNTDSEKKPTIKKKIIRKVSSKTKADSVENNDKNETKTTTDKKKVIKKLRDKINEDIAKNNETKKDPVVKKRSVLQSIGQKFEKFTSPKSNSLDKDKLSAALPQKKDLIKKDSLGSSGLSRNQREQSVPAQSELPSESNLIKRAVTLTDVAALENQPLQPNKTTVSKVLGLFKKFDSKEKVNKLDANKIISESKETKTNASLDIVEDDLDNDKPKRPTSLLLNGLGRKYKYGRTASDSVSVSSMPNCTSSEVNDKKDDTKNLRNSLKLDFSRLPRVKKIVPTNPVIEPQIVNLSYNTDKETEPPAFNNPKEPTNELKNIDIIENRIRSRSRSKSDISRSESKSDKTASDIDVERNNHDTAHQPLRNHEPTTPEKEDIGERIRRKSFYTRFNEKRQRRKSNLVGPGAAEYDPVARLHYSDIKSDISPTSPVSYDLSPGFSSVASDLSPSTERYRSLNTELPIATRNSLRFDNYGTHDKIDSYRSLDRGDLRKYSNSKSYGDYETPSSYVNRYNRTYSLLDSSEGNDESSYLREPQKYNRTLSLYAPGSYATYRPKRIRNSAIILKESEKEPSPENILDKIRQKKISISVTRRPDPDKEPPVRSNVPSKGEGDGTERSEKVD